MLDQHHGDVVAFLGIGDVEDRLAARLHPHRLVVEHPVSDIVVAFLGQDIRRLPGLGQAGSEPAAREFSRRLQDHLGALADVGALVFHLLHVALCVAVADELPVALDASLYDVGIGFDRDSIDVHHAGNLEVVIDLQKPPEADSVAVFVPAPVRNVGHRRAAGRRRQHGARHGLGRVPVFDIGDRPHRHARALRQLERLARRDRGIIETIIRQHADRGLGKVHGNQLPLRS